MNFAMSDLATLVPRLFDLGLNLLTAMLILVLGWWGSALLGKWVRRIAGRSTRVDPTVIPIFHSTVVWSIRIFTLVAVLARFGVQTASIIAVLGAAGLAVGLALQGTLQNIAAGIMLLLLRPVRAGEFVTLSSGSSGTVEEVGMFLTRLVQPDGVHVSLPNSTVWNATITNFSRNPTRRFDMPVGIRYGDDLDQAIALLTRLVNEHPLALKEPAPEVRVFEYLDNVITVNVRSWVASPRYWEYRWDLLRQARLLLDENGYQPPVPVRVVSEARHEGARHQEAGQQEAQQQETRP
ncbi:mechanosensitive ion channel protein MscS [Bordetella genomosp. 10]|uniref:Small-conductance mechanosensitive channel n=1 Tax=Bordetella genomosp. 10 TaxID=1416804 RepID=A0A261S0X7_9BORD|nr:mechanosensitive ion channel domain-containing protein [Bordetella genomosp. 10]OZI30572.1 mechanosensitive ion channel protein MscS [Bordetella genomosp. 10]